MKYTSEIKRPGTIKAGTKKGKKIFSNGHLYIKYKEKWKEVY